MSSPSVQTRVGIAYAPYVQRLVDRSPGLVDYVEVPFERLRAHPETFALSNSTPLVLHCASLSVAGVTPASRALLNQVRKWVTKTATPWVGEHLSFVSAPGRNGTVEAIPHTVAPPLNIQTLERVKRAQAIYRKKLQVPLLLENPPQYFTTPGSTMSQPEFISALCAQSAAELLLDLSHFLITAQNVGFDAAATLREFPLERVREIHISGIRLEGGTAWDDHGAAAPERAFELLAMVLRRVKPQAVTLEYNWSSHFPDQILRADLQRIRRLLRTRSKS